MINLILATIKKIALTSVKLFFQEYHVVEITLRRGMPGDPLIKQCFFTPHEEQFPKGSALTMNSGAFIARHDYG